MFLKPVISNEIDIECDYNNSFDERNRLKDNNNNKYRLCPANLANLANLANIAKLNAANSVCNRHSYRLASLPLINSASISQKCKDIKVCKPSDPTKRPSLIGSATNCVGCALVWPFIMRVWSQCSLNLISLIGYENISIDFVLSPHRLMIPMIRLTAIPLSPHSTDWLTPSHSRF